MKILTDFSIFAIVLAILLMVGVLTGSAFLHPILLFFLDNFKYGVIIVILLVIGLNIYYSFANGDGFIMTALSAVINTFTSLVRHIIAMTFVFCFMTDLLSSLDRGGLQVILLAFTAGFGLLIMFGIIATACVPDSITMGFFGIMNGKSAMSVCLLNIVITVLFVFAFQSALINMYGFSVISGLLPEHPWFSEMLLHPWFAVPLESLYMP